MSETEAKHQTLPEDEQKSEIIAPITSDSKAVKAQKLETDGDETIEENNVQSSSQISNSPIKDINQSQNASDNSKISEEDISENTQIEEQNELDESNKTVNNLQSECASTSQQPPVTLERIYEVLIYLQKDIEEIKKSVYSLKEEVNNLKQQKTTTYSTKHSVETKRKPRSKTIDFNTVKYLQEHGEDKLQTELRQKQKSELQQIIRSEGIKSPKNLKTLECEDMVREIISNAKRQLKHGSVFLKD
jgi:hypothetical protein